MTQLEIWERWDASLYEQQENYRHDIDLLLSLLGDKPQRVLDVACGAGRMALPLGRAGHIVHGFDVSKPMLARMQAHLNTGEFPSVTVEHRDGLADAWPDGFDAVLLGANLLCNLITGETDYMAAQQLFLRRAHEALRPGGHLFLDFDCVDWPTSAWEDAQPWVCFDGTDERGTYGRYIVGQYEYDAGTRVCRGERIWELQPKDGGGFTVRKMSVKHFPSWADVQTWLTDVGFAVEKLYVDCEPAEQGREGCRITLWARKAVMES